MTISTKKRFRLLTAACALGMAGLLMQGVAYGAATVPSDWNVSTKANGAYMESFEGTVSWVPGATASELYTPSPNYTSPVLSPVRYITDWFSAGTQVLKLKTGATASLDNTLTYSGAYDVYATNAIYADMRVKFNAFSADPDSNLRSNSKLAVYVKGTTLYAQGSETKTATLSDLSVWHQLTVKIKPTGKADVYIDNSKVIPDVTLNSYGTANKLSTIGFSGEGYIDNLYVSYGNPAYAGVPGNMPSTSDAVATWISGKMPSTVNANASFSAMTADQLNTAYLVNELVVTDPANPASAGDPVFGIKSFELTSPTTLNVVVYLKVGSTPKTGTINGRIRVLSKATKGGTYVESATTTITSAEFASGTSTATYTFTVPSGDLFFKPTIIE